MNASTARRLLLAYAPPRRISSVRRALSLVIALTMCVSTYAQCKPDQASAAYARAMRLARRQSWTTAREALLEGERMCPRQKRFPVELAGVAFEQKHYPRAAAWLRKALKLDPKDSYANNLAGTVYLLMGNLPAALKYWNRVDKPQIHSLNFDPDLRVRPLILGRSFAFSPAAEMTLPQYETTRVRLNGLGIFRTYRIELEPMTAGSFDADFHALERNGFGGNRWAAAISTLSGLPYETIYPTYYNIARSAMNFSSLVRWDDQKRRVWVSLSGLLRDLPRRRWKMTFDARNENWAIRHSFTGTAPVLGSLNLQKQAGAFSVTDFVSGRLRWSTGAELSHRSYRNVQDGTALTPNIVLPGMELKYLLSVTGKPIDVPQRRLTLTTSAHSQTARIWSTPSHVFEKLQGSALLRWFPLADSNRWEVRQELRGGGIVGAAPFDELFMLGTERDNPLWLRGDLGTRDGRKGSAPLGTRYLLANSDAYRRIYGNGLINIQAGPLFDVGRMGSPNTSLSTDQWLFDSGIEARITILGTRVVLTWGHDLRSGHNAFFGTAL